MRRSYCYASSVGAALAALAPHLARLTFVGYSDRLLAALRAFGAPLFDLTRDDLTQPDTVFQIGVIPCRVDILTSISGVEFAAAWSGRLQIDVEGLSVPCIGRAELLANKRAAGRPQDLADLALLESAS